jgi:hypothetical protein
MVRFAGYFWRFGASFDARPGIPAGSIPFLSGGFAFGESVAFGLRPSRL